MSRCTEGLNLTNQCLNLFVAYLSQLLNTKDEYGENTEINPQ